MLYNGETKLLGGQFLYYSKVEFRYEEKEIQLAKPDMSCGRAYITNHRILFLSNESRQGKAESGNVMVAPPVLQRPLRNRLNKGYRKLHTERSSWYL